MYPLSGTGVPDLHLVNGFTLGSGPDGPTVSFVDLFGLYDAIAREVAWRRSPLSGGEFRFLRKRLGLSQQELAARFDKEEQSVAKWEKGRVRVPQAEGELLRLFVLSEYDPEGARRRLVAWRTGTTEKGARPYHFEWAGGAWRAALTERYDTARVQPTGAALVANATMGIGGFLSGSVQHPYSKLETTQEIAVLGLFPAGGLRPATGMQS